MAQDQVDRLAALVFNRLVEYSSTVRQIQAKREVRWYPSLAREEGALLRARGGDSG